MSVAEKRGRTIHLLIRKVTRVESNMERFEAEEKSDYKRECIIFQKQKVVYSAIRG